MSDRQRVLDPGVEFIVDRTYIDDLHSKIRRSVGRMNPAMRRKSLGRLPEYGMSDNDQVGPIVRVDQRVGLMVAELRRGARAKCDLLTASADDGQHSLAVGAP